MSKSLKVSESNMVVREMPVKLILHRLSAIAASMDIILESTIFRPMVASMDMVIILVHTMVPEMAVSLDADITLVITAFLEMAALKDMEDIISADTIFLAMEA